MEKDKPDYEAILKDKLQAQAAGVSTNVSVQIDSEQPTKTSNEWAIDFKKTASNDPLLHCLEILTRLEHNPISAETLRAGLPLVDGKLTPTLFIRAARRANISAEQIKRPLSEFSQLVLPAVLLLKDQSACVLVGINGNGFAEIIQPETKDGTLEIPIDELEEYYLGYAIFVRSTYKFDKRTDEEFYQKSKHWFWSVITKTWPLYSEILVASFLINTFAFASPLFVMNVYDRVVPNNALETLWVLAIGVSIVYTFDLLMRMLRGYFIDVAGKKSDVLLSASIFEQMLGVRMEARPDSVGVFANNMHQFESFREFFTSVTISTLIDLPFICLFLLVIYYIGGPLVFVPMVLIPIVIITGLLIQIPLNKSVKESYRYSAQKHAMLIEALGGVETIKANNAEGALQRKWEQAVGMAAKVNMKVKNWSITAVNVSTFAQQFASVCVVILGVYQIAEGNMTMGALIACTILTGRTMAPLAQVAGLLTRYHQSKAALLSLDGIMKMPNERPEGVSFLHRGDLAGDIQFKDVSFTYLGQSIPALKNVNFNIKKGEKVGIIGRIGSGKTTIEKLIMGLYHQQEGTILIDNTEINQLDPATLRRNIGYVPQDINLFYGSVKDNIVIGLPHVDDAQMLQAAQLAGVTEFVLRHPDGFDMQVGERGEKLSGGQRQTIAIARALLSSPPILVLDEPTNMMDNKSEEMIRENLKATIKDKTVFLITHKAALLSLVDRVILLDNSQVLADGPRDIVLKALAEGKIKTKQSDTIFESDKNK